MSYLNDLKINLEDQKLLQDEIKKFCSKFGLEQSQQPIVS